MREAERSTGGDLINATTQRSTTFTTSQACVSDATQDCVSHSPSMALEARANVHVGERC
jgi:hypothetical protein